MEIIQIKFYKRETMKKILKWIGIVLGALIGLLLVEGDLVVFAIVAEITAIY